MRNASTTSLDYLECPHCGARYLLRDQDHADLTRGERRWFDCFRCNERVRSATPYLLRNPVRELSVA